MDPNKRILYWMMISRVTKQFVAGLAFLLTVTGAAGQTREELPVRPYTRYMDSLEVWPAVTAERKIRFFLDSVIQYDYTPAMGEWLPLQKNTYTYHDDGSRKDLTVYARQDNGWTPAWRNLYEYDDGRLMRIEAQDYQGGVWTVTRQVVYTYDLFVNVTEQLTQNMVSPPGDWENSHRYLYEYDESQNRISRTYQQYAEDQWVNNHRYLWVYDHDTVLENIRQNWDNGLSAFVNDYKFLYEYNIHGLCVKEIQYNWVEGNSWESVSRVVYEHNPLDVVIRKLYESYQAEGDSWNPIVDYLYFQNKENRDTLILYRVWNNTVQIWDEEKRYLFDYDPYGNLQRETWQKWEGEWIHDYRIDYYVSVSGISPLRVDIVDSTEVTCYGYADGGAVAEASGGQSPYSYRWDDPAQTTTPGVSGLSGGIWYRVTVTDAAMNVAVDSIRLSQPPPVITGDISGPDEVDPRATAVYSVPCEEGAVYSWKVENGLIMWGQGSFQIEVKWRRCGSGKVWVTKTAANGCPGDTSLLEVEISPLGVEELPGGFRVAYFPNPAGLPGRVTFLFSVRLTATWSLKGISGQTFLQGEMRETDRLEVDVPVLVPGMYFWYFESNEQLVLPWVVK
ncbi:MAG TPA: hypothetical protein ENN63_02250 [Bacteroidetes bacterium]|nr:hypothetical protein [Bacteroidota bacterium]